VNALALREARAGDLETLVEFNLKLASETEDKTLDPATLRKGIAAVLADPTKGFYLVAEREGRVIGQLMVTREWSDWRNGDWWWFQSVYVAKDARRQGVFRALYGESVARARAADARGLRLYVEKENRGAQATYAALGMKLARYQIFELGEE
jgi:GNAT superfamily N-acetyltransferase